MVPHWSNGTIDGFYLTQEGVESYKKVPQKKIIQAEGTYLSLASCKNIGKDTKNEKNQVGIEKLRKECNLLEMSVG